MEFVTGLLAYKAIAVIGAVLLALAGMAWATGQGILLNDRPKLLAISAAAVGGEILQLSDGRACIIQDIDGVDSGEDAGIAVAGVFNITSASATLFSIGDSVYWDVSANLAIRPESAIGTDFYLGKATKAKANGDLVVRTDLNVVQVPELQYSNDLVSAEVEDTTTPTNFDKNYTFPANDIEVGDVINIKGYVYILDTNSTDTLLIKLLFAGVELHATTALDVADGDLFIFEMTVIVRTIGASGTFIAFGMITQDAPGGAMVSVEQQSSAIDTTGTNLVAVQATWSVAHADNEVRLEGLVVTRQRK